MSIMKRIRDITVASFNEMLEKAENPVRMIDQYLYAKREQLYQADRLYQQCQNHSSSLRQQYLAALELKEKREHQAELALKAGEEDIARVILQEKMQAEEKSEQYRELYEQAQQSLQDLEEDLHVMRRDYQEVADKRTYYVSRMESAMLQRRINQQFGPSGDFGPSSCMFYRMEDHVTDMELEARAMRDVRRATQEGMAPRTPHPALERELEALRKKLNQEG